MNDSKGFFLLMVPILVILLILFVLPADTASGGLAEEESEDITDQRLNTQPFIESHVNLDSVIWQWTEFKAGERVHIDPNVVWANVYDQQGFKAGDTTWAPISFILLKQENGAFIRLADGGVIPHEFVGRNNDLIEALAKNSLWVSIDPDFTSSFKRAKLLQLFNR